MRPFGDSLHSSGSRLRLTSFRNFSELETQPSNSDPDGLYPHASQAQASRQVASVRGAPTLRYSRNPISIPSRRALSKTMMLATDPSKVKLPASVEKAPRASHRCVAEPGASDSRGATKTITAGT